MMNKNEKKSFFYDNFFRKHENISNFATSVLEWNEADSLDPSCWMTRACYINT